MENVVNKVFKVSGYSDNLKIEETGSFTRDSEKVMVSAFKRYADDLSHITCQVISTDEESVKKVVKNCIKVM